MALPEWVRELRPHFFFWLLERVVGALVIAAVLAGVQYVQHHLDAVAILVVFVASILALAWLDRRKQPIALTNAAVEASPGTLQNAPALWVDYKPAAISPPETESLTFTKEGDATIKITGVGPLVWIVKETRPLDIHSAIGPLRTQPVECKFSTFERIGDTKVLKELPDLLREIMGRLGNDARPSVEISYEDFAGNRFCRSFTLLIDPFNRVVWDPGPARVIREKSP